jgi:hypothetical protein
VIEVLRNRTLDIIYDLFLWDEAQFEFYDNEPFPDDLIRIEVEPNAVVMEGIYRIDEMARYRTLIPSDRTVLELGPGWTSSLNLGKEVRQILYLLEKGMTVAEICYQMHSSSFHVLGQLCELVSKGLARVAGEAPETPDRDSELQDLPETVSELLWVARSELDEGRGEKALSIIRRILEQEPKNAEAQSLLLEAEEKFVKHVYAHEFPLDAVPKLLVPPEGLTHEQIGSQEGFVLSRINGEWDIQSILSICPFREADSLRMIKTLLDNGIIGF